MDKKEAAAAKFKEMTASKRFKLPEGSTTFRVMPNKKGLEKAEYIEYRMHSNVGARNAYLRCGKNIKGEGECWLCDKLIPKLEKSGKASHKKAAEALKAKDCFAVQIIYVSEGKWIGPVLWEMTAGVASKILGVMSRRDVSNPEKGYNLTISRTGTTRNSTRYGDIDRDDEKSAVPESKLAKLKTFGEVLKKYDEANMKTEYYGHEQEEEEEKVDPDDDEKATEEPEEEEAPAKPAKKPAKKPVVEEEDEPVAEEEEEEAPAKPVKKPAKKPVVEEEEEESQDVGDDEIPDLEEETEGESTEEEEEAPAKPAKKPVKKQAVEEEEEEAPAKPVKKKPKPVADDDDVE